MNRDINAARIGAAIANISRGAAAGGLYGAAAGAAKSFLPELVKAAGILLAVLILLPLLVLTALPNILFGFGGSASDDIISMNNSAEALGTAYDSADTYTQPAIDSLAADTQALFDNTEFDSIEVSQNIGNMDKHWFIAITSAANAQELSVMDASTVERMTKEKLTSEWAIIPVTTGEGKNAETSNVLKIDVRDLTPSELMDKLGFTQQQRDWATAIYETLAEAQSLDYAYSDGDGYYGTDYGNIVFTDTETEVVYYNQTDARWGGQAYGKTGTIARSGCGPTALAIAVASLVDDSVTPIEVARWSADNGYYAEGSGSYRSLIPDGGEHYGLTVTGLGLDAEQAVESLKQGKLVIAIMAKGHFTKQGHFIVLRGVTTDGNILVADPASVKRSGQTWPLSLIVNEAKRSSGSGGPFWSLEKKG
ncbi:MAG: C39 family peptidase [Oscillospiraceae bacterium]|jgi:hypothetical protein|nr:C39 family peptidase [Oscillospiraceae bacterium]